MSRRLKYLVVGLGATLAIVAAGNRFLPTATSLGVPSEMASTPPGLFNHTTSDLPTTLAWQTDDRDCEIILAKTRLADVAQELINAVETYNDDLARYSAEYQKWEAKGPYYAAVFGRQLPIPDPVEREHHMNLIKAACGQFDSAFEWFDAECKRIDAQYEQQMAQIAPPQADEPLQQRLPPAECDALISVCCELRLNLPNVLESMTDGHMSTYHSAP